MFGKVWGLLSAFYSNVLKPFVSWSWAELQKLHTWLKTTLGPTLKFLRAVRADILSIYTKWLRPVFDTIDATRATLRLLADFHLKFAQQLDAKLADLESRLLAPIRFALTKINEVINVVNLAIDEFGLFQRATLLASLYRSAGDAWSALITDQAKPPAGYNPDAARARTVTPVDAATLARQVTDYYTTGGGELADDINAYVALWQTSANDV